MKLPAAPAPKAPSAWAVWSMFRISTRIALSSSPSLLNRKQLQNEAACAGEGAVIILCAPISPRIDPAASLAILHRQLSCSRAFPFRNPQRRPGLFRPCGLPQDESGSKPTSSSLFGYCNGRSTPQAARRAFVSALGALADLGAQASLDSFAAVQRSMSSRAVRPPMALRDRCSRTATKTQPERRTAALSTV